MRIDRCTFFESLRAATKRLPDDMRLALYDTVLDYVFYGTEPEFGEDMVMADNLFIAFRPILDNSVKAAESGKKGGESKNKSTLKNPPCEKTSSGVRSEKEIEIEVEREVEKENTPHTPRKRWDTALEENEAFRSLPDRAQNAAREWLCYKREKQQGYTERGLRSFVTEFANKVDQYGESAVCGLVNECMANNWRSIIWDKLARGEPRAGGAQLVKNPAGGFDLK